MATYAIGDIQGCYNSLLFLLDKLDFNPHIDRLWLTGDLVNRGGQSLQTLEFLYSIRDNIVTVLGNHDLHLIAAFHGHKILAKDSELLSIIRSPNGETLINWLQQQPLLHHQHNHVLVHAGIAPTWTLNQAKRYANEVETILRSKNANTFLKKMYGDKPTMWSENLSGQKRLRCIVNHFTRMRFIEKDGRLNLSATVHPSHAPKKLLPWFSFANRPTSDMNILFGHWAALMGDSNDKNAIALDTGCVWGGKLTAYDLDRKTFVRCNNKQ